MDLDQGNGDRDRGRLTPATKSIAAVAPSGNDGQQVSG